MTGRWKRWPIITPPPFDPQVDCILDIGGQDMKCIKIKKRHG